MSKHKRAVFVALSNLLRRRFVDVDDPVQLIRAGSVFVNGALLTNPNARVRSDASIRIAHPHVLRGTTKLNHALRVFGIDVEGAVAVDLGASAGGFSQSLLDAGAARVYAVDAGWAQLRGSLRADSRVVNLERTNLSDLDSELVPELIDLVTIDLSYLALTDAIRQLGGLRLSRNARLIALVKPTFELGAAVLAARPDEVDEAVHRASSAIELDGWQVVGEATSQLRGAKGAVEVFLFAVAGSRGTDKPKSALWQTGPQLRRKP